jgi:hypothetical protein
MPGLVNEKKEEKLNGKWKMEWKIRMVRSQCFWILYRKKRYN